MPINFYQLIVLVVLALVLLGPERLPQYARNLARWTKKVRYWAEDAKDRFKDETGTDFDDVDWQKYDPRQYDPRRIIREALSEEFDELDPFQDSSKPRQPARPPSGKPVDPLELFGAGGTGGETPPRSGPTGSASTPQGSAQLNRVASDAGRGGAVAAGVAGAAGAVGASGSGAASSGTRVSEESVQYADEDPLSVHRAPFDTEAT